MADCEDDIEKGRLREADADCMPNFLQFYNMPIFQGILNTRTKLIRGWPNSKEEFIFEHEAYLIILLSFCAHEPVKITTFLHEKALTSA